MHYQSNIPKTRQPRGLVMTAEIEKAPRGGGALSAKAQSGSLVVSIYSATYKPSGPIRPGPKRMLWSQFQVFDALLL